jgi:hypothetical protein
MGSPARPTQPQIEQLLRSSRMEERPIAVGPRMNDGSAILETRLPRQGVELIELIESSRSR